MPQTLTADLANAATEMLDADDRELCREYGRRLLSEAGDAALVTCLSEIREWLELDEILLFSSSMSYTDHRSAGAGYDPVWMGLYMREGFAHIDPIVNAILRGNRFFPRHPLIHTTSSLAETRSAGPLMRRLIEAAKDFRRPAHGYAGGMIEGSRLLLLSATSNAACTDDRRRNALGALFPVMMQALAQPDPQISDLPKPSRREIHLLKLLAEGLNDAEIADALSISQATVRFHLQNLFQKLRARNRCHVISLAYRHGYLATGH